MLQSFNRRWRFLGGDTDMATDLTRSAGGFNRRWRFLGGDTWLMPQASWASPAVSIAGGDSWVGIHGSLMPVGTEGLDSDGNLIIQVVFCETSLGTHKTS